MRTIAHSGDDKIGVVTEKQPYSSFLQYFCAGHGFEAGTFLIPYTQRNKIVDICRGETFDSVGGAVIDFYFAGILQNHAAGENHAAAHAVDFIILFRH